MKHAYFGKNLDLIPYHILKVILNESYENYKDIIQLIKIDGEIEKNILTLYIHPIGEKKIHFATYDLEDEKIISHIDRNKLLEILDSEIEKIEILEKKEFDKSVKIVISIIGLILGIIVTYLILKIF